MLDEILKEDIDSVNKNAKIEINSMKYIANLIKMKDSIRKQFNGYSEGEIYKQLKNIIGEMYNTYSFEESILTDNLRNRDKENISKSIILGFEELKGSNKQILDGYLDTGEILKLTQKGKEILNGYRLARDELTIKDYKKQLTRKICELSNHLN